MYGDMAQLVAHRFCKAKVSGSSPDVSTPKPNVGIKTSYLCLKPPVGGRFSLSRIQITYGMADGLVFPKNSVEIRAITIRAISHSQSKEEKKIRCGVMEAYLPPNQKDRVRFPTPGHGKDSSYWQ